MNEIIFLLKSASCFTLNTPRGAPLAHGSYPNFYGSGHPVEYCDTASQWGLKSLHESYSADDGKAPPLVLACSHFERTPRGAFQVMNFLEFLHRTNLKADALQSRGGFSPCGPLKCLYPAQQLKSKLTSFLVLFNHTNLKAAPFDRPHSALGYLTPQQFIDKNQNLYFNSVAA